MAPWWSAAAVAVLFLTLPAPTQAEESDVDLSLSCEGICGAGRATNGKPPEDEEYKYCLCSNACTNIFNFGFYTKTCCTDFKEKCASTSLGSCQVTGYEGETLLLCDSYNEEGLCDCSAACLQNGDCCSDFTDFCTPSPPPPPTSCEGKCAEEDPDIGGICHCDLYCTLFGDCCFDYEEFCGQLKTCKGFCDDVVEGSLCECDVFCTAYGDCCADYTQECDPNKTPSGEIAGSTPCTSLDCGSCKDSGECCCDQYCDFFANCCEGFHETCPIVPPPPGPSIEVAPGDTQENPLVFSSLPLLYQGSFTSYTPQGTQLPLVLDACAAGAAALADVVVILDYGLPLTVTIEANLEINSNQKIYDEVPQFFAALTVVKLDPDSEVLNATASTNAQTACSEEDERDLPSAFASFLYRPGDIFALFLTGYGNSTLGDFSLKVDTIKGDNMDDPIIVEPLTDGGSIEFVQGTLGYTDTYKSKAGDSSECTTTLLSSTADVWYQYKPKQPQSLRLDLCTASQDFEGALYIVTSTSKAPEVHEACVLTNEDPDEACDGYSLSTVFTVEKDADNPITYYFVVETKKSQFKPFQKKQGDFRFAIAALTGNIKLDPIPILAIPAVMTGNTEMFSDENVPPSIGECKEVLGKGPDVVYKYTATSTRDLVAWVCGESGQATLLYMFQEDGKGQQVGALCSDSDAYGDCEDGSALVVQAEAGQEYVFVVDSRQFAGKYSFFVEFAACDDLDFPCFIEALPFDATYSLAAHSNSVPIPQLCTDLEAGNVDGLDLVLKYDAKEEQSLLVKVCADYVTGFYVILTSGEQTSEICYVGCVHNDECLDYIVPVEKATSYMLVIEGVPSLAKDGTPRVVTKASDYELLVSVAEYDKEEPKACVGAAELFSSPPPQLLQPPAAPHPPGPVENKDDDKDDDDSDDGGSSAGAILGAIVGVLLLLGCVVGFVYYIKMKMARGKGKKHAKAMDVFNLDEETEQLTGASRYHNVAQDSELNSLDKELEGL